MEAGRQTTGGLRGNSPGGASLISLITVLAAFFISSTYLYLAQADLRMTTRYVQSKQALYLAEAGVELARSQLAIDPDWRPALSYTLGTGAFSLDFGPPNPGVTVLSTGKSGSAARKLEVMIAPTPGGGWQVTSYREVFN